jgi:hypothetical protein
MISKDKIFTLFEDNEDIDPSDSFIDNPYTKIGMFMKTLGNSKVFTLMMKNILDKVKTEYNEEDINHHMDNVTFNAAFSYIKEIDVNNPQHLDALECHNPEKLILNLNQSLAFFEGKEEYEKCAHLFKIINVFEDFAK